MKMDIIFARLGMLLVSCQLIMMGAKTGLFNRNLCSLGEDLAKQGAASSRKGVVGKPGRAIPRQAKATQIRPNIMNSVRRIFLLSP